MSSTLRNLVVWVVLGSLMVYVFNNLNSSSARDQISYSEFQRDVISGNVEKVIFKGDSKLLLVLGLTGQNLKQFNQMF